jgi:FkbM family methyltransferase
MTPSEIEANINEYRSARLLPDLHNFRKIFILGSGYMGRKTNRVLSDNGLEIAGFFETTDSQVGALIDGRVVLSIDEVIKHNWADALIVIAIYQPGYDARTAIDFFKGLGFDNVYTVVDLFQLFESGFLPDLFFDSSYNVADDPRLTNVYQSLCDDCSRELFIQTLAYRTTMQYEHCPRVTSREYFPSDLFPSHNLERCVYVDVGAYDGDTIMDFAYRHPDVRLCIGLEPDTTNFRKMLRRLSSLATESSGDILLHCAAAGDRRQIAPFSYEGGMGSHLDSTSSDYAQIFTLDELVIPHTTSDDIVCCKVDVEGNEIAVLNGASSILQQRRVSLAISVYHKPDCIFRVWEVLVSMLPRASFYLRQHGNWGMDLTMYCVFHV